MGSSISMLKRSLVQSPTSGMFASPVHAPGHDGSSRTKMGHSPLNAQGQMSKYMGSMDSGFDLAGYSLASTNLNNSDANTQSATQLEGENSTPPVKAELKTACK